MRPATFIGAAVVAVALAFACAADDGLANDDWMDDDFPPYGCDSEPTGPACTGSSGESGSSAAQCQLSADCPDGGVCAAEFDGDIGTFSCQSLCIAAMDDTQWCSDDTACCDEDAVCSRGYCLPPEGGTSSTDAGPSSGTDTGSSSEDTGASSSGGESSG